MNGGTITLKALQQRLLGTQTAFVSYRLPGETAPESIVSAKGFIEIPHIREVFKGKSGFIMAPFLKSRPPLFLDAELTLSGTQFTDPGIGRQEASPVPECRITAPGKEEYIEKLLQVISGINAGKADKVVISRPIAAPVANPELVIPVFEQLCADYPHAFVYLAWMPGYGLWAGASPELLLNIETNKVTTMALAGTRPAAGSGAWGTKEIDEHEWVCRHIEEKLAASGCNEISRSETETMTAGTVVHLKTGFKAIVENKSKGILPEALHPTPAVCGWPEKAALDIIKNAENYDRSFYTGFLGPVKSPNQAEFFVNLRCMQIFQDKAIVYAGGGITAASDPLAEWEETVLKSQTMLTVIRKMQNLAYF